MIQRLQGKVEKLTIIKNVGENIDLCELTIDFDILKIFYDSNELHQFVGNDVIYTVRKDVVDGVLCEVICELALLSTIQTVSRSENVKLIPEKVSRTMCNIAIKDTKFGEFYPGVTALMSSFQFGSSSKAKWFDCKMIDMHSKEFVVRWFSSGFDRESAEDMLNNCVGKYNAFDMEYTRYGYQTKELTPLPQEVEESPEVIVAKEVMWNMVQSDSALMSYCTKYNFFENISGIINGEPGYEFVVMASELYMVNAISDVTCDLDIRAIKRAIICTRGYLLPRKTAWSKPLLNNTKVMQVGELKMDRELLLIIDALSEEEPSPTKLMYIKVRGLVNDIVKIRRGIKNEEDIANIVNVGNVFNGLL